MKSVSGSLLGLVSILLVAAFPVRATAPDQVKISSGIVQGIGPQKSGVRIFKGIPFAEPPVGELRWKPPKPVQSWNGVRQAVQFGPRCMQPPIFSDMVFRSNGMSEDCLYLNVWTPAQKANQRLPVLVYFYGGGFVAGDGSEPRYDGESMAAKGIVSITTNYRLGVFGFLAHPELTQSSPQHASGNYGLLDQVAALRWGHQNISAFGGDPNRITIAGESAGSISVSTLMVSPLSRSLLAGAIGESGSIIAGLRAVPLKNAEDDGLKFANSINAGSLAQLRAKTTAELFDATSKLGVGRFPLTFDGHLLPEPPLSIYMDGEQARVPLLVGWNSEEANWRAVLGPLEPTSANYQEVIRKLYPEHAETVLKLYPAETMDEVIQAATDLAGDRFLGFSTWKWFDLHRRTSGQPVYRYFYSRPRPALSSELSTGTKAGLERKPARARGAVHSAEIEYALGNLSTNKVYAWTADDYKLSKLMQEYFANFVKKGDPNGPGLPPWPAVKSDAPVQVMRLDAESRAEEEKFAARYQFLDQLLMRTVK